MNQPNITTSSIDLPAEIELPEKVQSVFMHDLKLTIKDIASGVSNYQTWSFMGFSEIRRRYRRTLIGPFWTTLSLGIFIACMGVMLSNIWHSPAKEFLPYFCSGFICWTIIQTIILEGCSTFTSAETFIRQVSLPYSLYSCLIIWRNMIVFFHHLVILALVLLYARTPLSLNIFLIIPGLLIVFVTGVWVTTLLGMVCARFRDIQQIINSMLQLAMFVTPIMWKPDQLGRKGMLMADLNPLYHYISILRLPLIGEAPSMLNWAVSIGLTIAGSIFTVLFLSKYYRRIVFWL